MELELLAEYFKEFKIPLSQNSRNNIKEGIFDLNFLYNFKYKNDRPSNSALVTDVIEIIEILYHNRKELMGQMIKFYNYYEPHKTVVMVRSEFGWEDITNK